ncbi:MAG: polysaccharide biosynthesis protein [Phycisphaerae bacterium]|nr:polysaccharide biosynthesis protein [Gemmatimonadaceae bacterium]
MITTPNHIPSPGNGVGVIRRRTLRNRHVLVLDVLSLILSCVIAYTIRFEGFDPWLNSEQRNVLGWFLTLAVPMRLALFWFLGLYRRYWSLASVAELERVLAASVAAAACSFAVGIIILPVFGFTTERMPYSVATIDALLVCAGITIPRIAARFSRRRREQRNMQRELPSALIVGAGAAGQMAARELRAHPQAEFLPVGFLDDDRTKRWLLVADLPVVGTVDELAAAAKALSVQHIIIAMPSAPGTQIRRIMKLALDAGLQARTVPSLFEIMGSAAVTAKVREIRIEDLLQREPVKIDSQRVRTLTEARSVLVTGAGGSIGSELCRQVAKLRPERLILVGRGENSIFEIQQELRDRNPWLETVPVIVDVRERATMADVMMRHAPSVVFHAAAHKHVPLMEANVLEALRNNVLGTQSVVDASLAAGVPHLVLISTDKAVRPTSVMGASKRIAEQIVQIAARESGRAYVSVRFGNVLGSRGSVVPTFLRQIRTGGPVMITHPEMRRYFMTIPEAVQLVLQAVALGRNGEVFCLDMGEPVTILSLARDLIQLSGLEPYKDIDIQFTGARPGEKLYEEMFFGSEEAVPTEHPKVLCARKAQLHASAPGDIAALRRNLERSGGVDEQSLRAAIRSLVEDFGTDDAPALSPQELNDNARREELLSPAWNSRITVDATVS